MSITASTTVQEIYNYKYNYNNLFNKSMKSNNHHLNDSPIPISIDDVPNNKKRTLEDGEIEESPSFVDPNSSPPVDTTGITLDIAWREILQLIDSFRNQEPGFLSLGALQPHIQHTITEEIHNDINNLREHTHMPLILARAQFDTWTSCKPSDDLLSVHQLDIVLHFTDILYTEFYMEIEMRTFQDKSMLLQQLTDAYPQDAEMINDALTAPSTLMLLRNDRSSRRR